MVLCAYFIHVQQAWEARAVPTAALSQQAASIEADNHSEGRVLAVQDTELEKPQFTHSSPRGVRAQRRLPYPESLEEALLKASRC